MDDVAILDDIGGACRLQLEGRAVVHDMPAVGLETGLERIGGGPVTCRSGRGSLLGQGHDLRGRG